MILALLLLTAALGQVTTQYPAPVHTQFDASGATQQYKRSDGLLWNFVATGYGYGVAEVTSTGALVSQDPNTYPVLYSWTQLPPLSGSLYMAALDAHTQYAMFQYGVQNTKRYRAIIAWLGYEYQASLPDLPANRRQVMSYWAFSQDCFTFTATVIPPGPTDGTFSVWDCGPLATVRAPTAPAAPTIRQ